MSLYFTEPGYLFGVPSIIWNSSVDDSAFIAADFFLAQLTPEVPPQRFHAIVPAVGPPSGIFLSGRLFLRWRLKALIRRTS